MPKKTTAFPSHELDRFIVRLPDGMRARIQEEADKNGRSMNAEIVVRLEESFRSPRREQNLMDSLQRHETLLLEAVERIEALDPEFAAKRKRMRDFAEEASARRAQEAKKAEPVTPPNPRRRKR